MLFTAPLPDYLVAAVPEEITRETLLRPNARVALDRNWRFKTENHMSAVKLLKYR